MMDWLTVYADVDCSGTAQAYFQGSQFAQLSETHGYVLLYPSSVSSPHRWYKAYLHTCAYSPTPAPAGMFPPTRRSHTTEVATRSVSSRQSATQLPTGASMPTASSSSEHPQVR